MLTFGAFSRSNAQRSGMVMWDEVINEIATEFPDVTLDHMLGKFEPFLPLVDRPRRSHVRHSSLSREADS